MTWRQLSGLDRKNGLSVEDKDSPNFALIESQDTSDQKLAGEQFYFHIRVEETGKFRIFGYQIGRCFSITHIDPKGKINH